MVLEQWLEHLPRVKINAYVPPLLIVPDPEIWPRSFKKHHYQDF
jgi:hypothetical protein